MVRREYITSEGVKPRTKFAGVARELHIREGAGCIVCMDVSLDRKATCVSLERKCVSDRPKAY